MDLSASFSFSKVPSPLLPAIPLSRCLVCFSPPLSLCALCNRSSAVRSLKPSPVSPISGLARNGRLFRLYSSCSPLVSLPNSFSTFLTKPLCRWRSCLPDRDGIKQGDYCNRANRGRHSFAAWPKSDARFRFGGFVWGIDQSFEPSQKAPSESVPERLHVSTYQ